MQSNLKDIDTPVCPQKFVEQFTRKCESWDDFVVTTKLQDTWKINCLALNNAIHDKDSVMKYVVSAPTGSAKTQNLITYCTMLTEEITALISTNLTDEADDIAKQINKEADKEIAYSHHSNKGISSKESLEKAIEFQIVITTHESYKRNYSGGEIWEQLGANRNLIVVDEALDTMKEISVSSSSIEQAIAFFSSSKIREKYKSNKDYKKEIKMLEDDLAFLNDSESGTILTHSNAYRSGESKDLSFKWSKYRKLALILGIDIYGEGFTAEGIFFRKTIRYNHILTGIDDTSNDSKIEENLKETITNLNKMLEKRQTYITANLGKKSFNRVEDMIPQKSLVCFDATADVNEVYTLRAKYYNDIHMVEKINNVRDYSNVTMHTVMANTGKDAIDVDIVSSVLKSITLGIKTLIITHKANEVSFKQVARSDYSDKIIEVAHWNAITGLNTWKDFDTCIIVGLNHKPMSYAQNRVIISTPNEEMAFGEEQKNLNSSVATTVIVSEIIQAINRIRIRTVTEKDGGCESANIYIALPRHDNYLYKKLIQAQMPNIKMFDWSLKSNITYSGGKAHFETIISYLEGNLTIGATVPEKKLKKDLRINANSYRDVLGKTDAKKKVFKEKLQQCGFDIIEIYEKDRYGRSLKKPIKYFLRVS